VLSKKDRKRQRLAKRLDKQTEACLDNQCRNKVQHEDFWTAMMHCKQLSQMTGVLYAIYYCEDCGFGHVGHAAPKHTDQPTITWMMEGYAETISTKVTL